MPLPNYQLLTLVPETVVPPLFFSRETERVVTSIVNPVVIRRPMPLNVNFLLFEEPPTLAGKNPLYEYDGQLM